MPDVSLFEGFGILDPVGIPLDITTHATHSADMLRILTDHYGQHRIVDTEKCQVELKTFNSVVAGNAGLRRMTVHQLMFH